jgi:hypothetical protein
MPFRFSVDVPKKEPVRKMDLSIEGEDMLSAWICPLRLVSNE